MVTLQIGCLIITGFIMALYFSTKRVRTSSHRVYCALLILSVFYLIFDRITVYTVNHLESTAPVLNQVMHRFFLMSLLGCVYLIFRYVLLMIFPKPPHIRASYIPMVCSVAAAGVLPLYYRVTDAGNYSYGPAAWAVYVSVVVYAGMTVFFLLRHFKEMERKKRDIVLLSIVFQITVSAYQAVNPLSLVSCLGIVLVDLGFFLTVESPDVHLIELLKEEKERADTANKAKSAFLANMSHEIRTPIHAVMGMSEMILRESSEDDILSYAGDINTAAETLLGIVNDILDFSKIESGKMEIIPVSYQLSSLMHDIYLLIHGLAGKKGLAFEVEVDETLPSVLYGDDVRLRQILINLLTNAVKYTEKGSVRLCVTGNIKGEGCELVFRVKDTGIGIKEEDMERLFQAFERIEEKRNRKTEGNGLGINITRQLLELMDSELKVESVYGEGSCFSFRLVQRIVRREPVGSLDKQFQQGGKKKAHRTTFVAPEAHVLVTDDIEMNRKVFRGLLKQTGISVDEAGSGQECIRKAGQTKYDMIFLDHMMPDMDGIQTMRALRDDPAGCNHDTPVIVLTANNVSGAREEYIRAGFDSYLSKPIDPVRLEKELARYLPAQKKQMPQSVPETEMPERKAVPDDAMENEAPERKVAPQAVFDQLPAAECFHWDQAKRYMKDETLLMDTLRGFRDTLLTVQGQMEQWIQEPEQNPAPVFEDIRFTLHSLKGLSASVGAVTISELSGLGERSAVRGEGEKIRAVLLLLLQEIMCATEELAPFFTEEQKPLCTDTKFLLYVLKNISDAMRNLDFDEADRQAEWLERHRYEETTEEDIRELLSQVIRLDDREAMQTAGRLIERLQTEEVT